MTSCVEAASAVVVAADWSWAAVRMFRRLSFLLKRNK